MKKLNWQFPWPQWRTHWHVWHAWPVLAQTLLLTVFTICFSALGSWYGSAQAWQAWMDAEQEDADLLQSLEQLREQSVQLEKIRAQLQDMKHPTGLPLAAWESPPKMDSGEEEAVMQQLAKQHGLQLLAFNEEGAQWRGPFPHVLAAWQNLAVQMPHYRMMSFNLKRIEDASVLEPINNNHLEPTIKPHRRVGSPLVHLQWQWTTAIEKEAPIRPVNLKQAPPSPTEVLPEPITQVWHNPFAIDGLAQTLPSKASNQVQLQGLYGQNLMHMQWVGMLSKDAQTQALVRHEGSIHALTLGQALGQDFGEVVKIASDHLLLREWHVNEFGQWQARTTRFPLGKKP